MKGQQALKRIHQHYKISETDVALLELQDLLTVALKNDNLGTFLNGAYRYEPGYE